MDTAVLLAVPEAEPLVHDWRGKGDPSAAHGVPAHVTLLHPFLPSDARSTRACSPSCAGSSRGWTRSTSPSTRSGASRTPASSTSRPPGPALTELSRALARRWPECPPYAGKIGVDDLVAHLTIVHTEDRALRQSAGDAVSPQLPLVARASTASLWVCDDAGEWSEQHAFAFGEGD